ncbi:hypothetical protein [Gracilinema caldarium]|uniref:hypothetical protein n=1 Tax=Gracilinema caldarium TaxID=215591 RepID=UPI0026ED584C|nr:hypothetical protein [Gracilinema caldarium]
MMQPFFLFWYILWPLIPLLFYLQSLESELNQYTLSVVLGLYSFIWLCNQFILAARPKLLVRIFGTKVLTVLHSVMPLVIIILTALHRMLKISYGFSPDTVQARLGAFAWWLYALVIIFTLFLMANTILMKVSPFKRFKDFVYAKTGLTYKRARLFHNITLIGAFALFAHISLASSSQFSHNPWGTGFLILWMLFSLVLYVRYRLRGRKS